MARYDRDELPAEQPASHDTELTLGPAMLFGLFAGLVLLCGICFGAGYVVGHRGGAAAQAGDTQPDAPFAAQGTNAQKPGATNPLPAQAATPVADAQTPPSATEPGTAPAAMNPAPAATQAASNSAQTQPAAGIVKPALPQSQAPQTASSMAQPAPAGTMVQVAAVSHAEDADVLVTALRRRGYTVATRRVPGDNLIHVQVGPFANRADAAAMAQRLLGDGYNASVLP